MLLKSFTKALIKAHIYSLDTGPIGIHRSRVIAVQKALDELKRSQDNKDFTEKEQYVPRNYTDGI